MPHLQFEQFEEVEHSTIKENYGISIRNSGLGQARITGIEVHVGKEFFRFYCGINRIDYEKIIESLDRQKLGHLNMQYLNVAFFVPNIYVDKGEELKLMSLSTRTPKEEVYNSISAANNMSFVFCYASIYGDQFYVADKDASSDDNSCRFDDTVKILGTRFRFYNPFNPPIDTKLTHGF